MQDQEEQRLDSDARQGADRPCIIYDGQCPFCRQQIERIQRRDPHDQFEYLAFEDPEVNRRYGQLDIGDLEAGLRLIIPDREEHPKHEEHAVHDKYAEQEEHAEHEVEPDQKVYAGQKAYAGHKVYTGHDAVFQIARRIAPWRPLAWLYHVPGARPLFGYLYAWIARHRHRFGSGHRPECDTDSCRP